MENGERRDIAELSNWLQGLDLVDYLDRLLQFGYNKLSLCTLLDDVTLDEMGVNDEAHRETILGAVGDLKRQADGVEEYDDGWSSDEAPVSEEEAPGGQGDMGATTMRFLSGLDSGKLEESYRQSVSLADGAEIDGMTDDFNDLPPPPPPDIIAAEPQYAEVKDIVPPPPPPPPDDVEEELNDEEERLQTGRFLASLSSSMGSTFLGDFGSDSFGNGSSRPSPPAPMPKPRSPMARDSPPVAPRPLPKPTSVSHPPPAPSPKPKPSVAPRLSKPKPPPPKRADASKAPDDLYAKPIKSPPPAAKPKGVKFDASAVDRQPSQSFKSNPKNRRSMVDVQDADVDLDALLDDLIEMEKDASKVEKSVASSIVVPDRSMASSAPPQLASPLVLHTTASQAAPSNSKPPTADEDDEFSKLMAEMEALSSTVPTTSARTSMVSPTLPSSSPAVPNATLSGATSPSAVRPSTSSPNTSIPSATVLSASSNNFSRSSEAMQVNKVEAGDDSLEALGADLSAGLMGSASMPNVSTHSFRPNANEVTVREVPNNSLVKLPATQGKLKQQLDHLETQIEDDATLDESEKEARLKAMKVQMAVEKLKEANIQKVVLKAYNDDGSSKMIVIDDKMTAREVCTLLMKKNRFSPSPNFVLIEQLTQSYLERRIEDHEKVVPVLNSWPRDSNNSIAFTNRPDKYMLLKRPQLFMPPSHAFAPGKKTNMRESTKRDIILKELFVAQNLPEIETFLAYKEGRKGSWKRYYTVLRKSGMYISTKGKSLAMKDLQRIVDPTDMDLYTGHAYRKKYKAATEFCFSLKPKGPLDLTERKIRHFCADTRQEQSAWVQGIRLAKLGNTLLEDYETTFKQMPWLSRESEDDIDGVTVSVSSEESKFERASSVSKRFRFGTISKGRHEIKATDIAGRSEAVPLPPDDSELKTSSEDMTEMTPWQRQFGEAWKHADLNESERTGLNRPPSGSFSSSHRLSSDRFSAALGQTEDGMYNVKF